jgi:LysM repeat protein
VSARRERRGRAAHYGVPVLFLVGVTVLVLVIRSGLEAGSSRPATTAASATRPSATVTSTRTGTTKRGARFYTVERGDTFGSISAKTGVAVSQIERLNPGVSPTALHVGQRLRVK